MKGLAYLLPALFKALLLPPSLIHIICRLLHPHLAIQALLYILAFPILYTIRTQISLLRTRRHARLLGAAIIPCVQGRWPLNLDVLIDWSRSGSEEEVGRMMGLLGREYGMTYNTRVLGEDQILTTDPALIRHVLNDDFGNFVKGKKFKERAEDFLGDGIFNSDGERWKFHRTFTRPHFHPTHVRPDLFVPYITRFLFSIPSKPFDTQESMGQLALQMSIAWMCGEDVLSDSVDSSVEWREARDLLGDALRDAQGIVGKRMKIGTVWPLFELTRDPLKEPMRIMRTFFTPLIAQALTRKGERSGGGDDDLHLIDRLVETTDDRKLIEDQLINILLASRDTTSSLLTFSSYILALQPDVSDRIRDEVLDIAGLEGEITKETIRDCRVSRAFINEVLRLFPPVPLNIRRSLRSSLFHRSDDKSSPPLYIPPDTSVVMAPILMQRSKEVWGPDAEVFNLDRWLGGEGLAKRERKGFVSWNIGPRMCLGQPFALTVAHTFLILLFRYMETTEGRRLRLAPQAQPGWSRIPDEWMSGDGDGRGRSGRDRVWVVADVVLSVKGGLWVTVD